MYIFQDKKYIRFDNEKEIREYFLKDGWSKDKKSWFSFDLPLENMSFPLFLQRDNSPDVLSTVGNVYMPMRDSHLESLKQEYNELQKLFNEPSAVTELEKIKAEIEDRYGKEMVKRHANNGYDYQDLLLVGIDIGKNIVDKHISELKGD